MKSIFKMVCLRFEIPIVSTEEHESNRISSFLAQLVIGILEKIIPEANPDYSEQINHVKTWLVEIDDETKYPSREIGIDENGKVIVAMPDNRNWGYWTDNDLQLDDFEKCFKPQKVEQMVFDNLWNEFKK